MKLEKAKKGGSDRQFSHIMSNADQHPVGLDFLLAGEMESAEAHVVFLVARNGLGIHRALCSQLQSAFRGQVLARLPAVFAQLEADLDLAVAFGALGFEGTVLAALTFVVPSRA